MNFRAIAVFSWACLVATTAIAGEPQGTRIEIDIDDGAPGEQSFVFDSETAGFELHSMAVGERRILTGDTGATAKLRRTEDGFKIDVNGKTIELMHTDELHGLHAGHDVEVPIDHADAQQGVVKESRIIKIVSAEEGDGLTVIAGTEIDPATRSRIKEAFVAGGHDGDVLFVDGNDLQKESGQQLHRRHEIRIIRKKSDLTN